MNRMTAVRITRGLVVEFHHAAELVPLPSGRGVFADPGFQDAGDLRRQLADFFNHAILLLFSNVRLESKRKHMDVHDGVARLQKIVALIVGDSVWFCQPVHADPELLKGLADGFFVELPESHGEQQHVKEHQSSQDGD
jgi:hypothetical protein